MNKRWLATTCGIVFLVLAGVYSLIHQTFDAISVLLIIIAMVAIGIDLWYEDRDDRI